MKLFQVVPLVQKLVVHSNSFARHFGYMIQLWGLESRDAVLGVKMSRAGAGFGRAAATAPG